MINFRDIIKSSEIVDTEDNLKEFNEIEPICQMDKETAYKYWDDLFQSATVEMAPIEEQILSDIFDRYEDEFVFDKKTESDNVQNSLGKFFREDWETISDRDKINCVSDFIDDLSESLNLENKQQLLFYEAEKTNCGTFNRFDNSIMINKCLLNNSKELVDTLAHEMRHAYQYQRACIGETYTDKLYVANFENYIEPKIVNGHFVNFLDYNNQFIEAEARAFAKVFSEQGVRYE